jgi:hypothetical protein
MIRRTSQRVAIFATNYGRTAGWDVLIDDSLVTSLEDVEWTDQFWFSYLLVPAYPAFFTHDFWESSEVKIRSRLTGEEMSGWFVNLNHTESRIGVRGLSLDPGFPWWPTVWERFLIRKWAPPTLPIRDPYR